MKKFLLRILFILIALVLSSKAFVALLGYQAVEAARDTYGDKVSISYGWISSGFDGALVFQDVVLTPYHLKRPFRVSELRLEYDNYYSLLRGLVGLKSLSLDGVTGLRLRGIRAPLEGRDVEQWLANEYGSELLAPLGLYSCGSYNRVGHEELKLMGILEHKADVFFQFPEASTPGGLRVAIDADLYELGLLGLEVTINDPLSDLAWLDMDLSDIDLSYVDNGYFRRIANMCETATGMGRSEFAGAAAVMWQAAMAKSGAIVGDHFVNSYYTFLSLGGRLRATMSGGSPVTIRRIVNTLDTNLLEAFDIALQLNGAPIDSPSMVLESAYFSPVVEEVAALPKSELKVVQSFQSIDLVGLDAVLGSWVKVVLSTGNVHEGVLRATGEFYFELVPATGGGNLTYNVKREDVAELYVRVGDS